MKGLNVAEQVEYIFDSMNTRPHRTVGPRGSGKTRAAKDFCVVAVEVHMRVVYMVETEAARDATVAEFQTIILGRVNPKTFRFS